MQDVKNCFQGHVEKILNRRFHYFAPSGIFHACLVASVVKEGTALCVRKTQTVY